MSEENEKIGEVLLVVKVPVDLKKALEELQYLELKGDKLKLYAVADIAREALLKGLRIILMEREILRQMIEKEGKDGAIRAYTSLVKTDK